MRFRHTIGDLADDLEDIVRKAPRALASQLSETGREGNRIARDFARESAGAHGVHYPKAFSWEMRKPFSGFGASVYSGEYGPDIAKPQGGMSFEDGSRNQSPHNDLAKSHDIIGPRLSRRVIFTVDRWFWE